MPSDVPVALTGLLESVGASGFVVARATRVVGQGDASGGRWCVPAPARRAGGTGGLGRAVSGAGTSAAIRGRRAAPAIRGPGGRARPRHGGACRRVKHREALCKFSG